MIDAQTQAVLQDVLRRESRSMLLYVGEAYPWATVEEEQALHTLQRLVREEGEAVARLGQYLTRRRVSLPALGVYPQHFTTINFLALDYLMPRLAEAQRRSIADLEADLRRLSDPEARGEVEKLLAVKRRHLPALEGLLEGRPERASVS